MAKVMALRSLAMGLTQNSDGSGNKTPVTARKDDAPAAGQAAFNNVAAAMAFSGGGGLIQTTSG